MGCSLAGPLLFLRRGSWHWLLCAVVPTLNKARGSSLLKSAEGTGSVPPAWSVRPSQTPQMPVSPPHLHSRNADEHPWWGSVGQTRIRPCCWGRVEHKG